MRTADVVLTRNKEFKVTGVRYIKLEVHSYFH